MQQPTRQRRKGGGKKSLLTSPPERSESLKELRSKKKWKKKKYSDAALFSALSEGERANALRILTADKRLSGMAKVGRYRVIAAEPFATKPPSELAGKRLARVVAYDYSQDRSVEATIDLDGGTVALLATSRAQPMLSVEEEDVAVDIALRSDELKDRLTLSDEPIAAMHYWSRRDTELAYSRRSAAVLFGQHGTRPSTVVIVDLVAQQVLEIVSGEQW